MIFKPNMYRKNIFDINYKKLKELGIKCLVFDLDNTLGLIDEEKCPSDTKKLLNKLKKDFRIFISSNNTKKRIIPYLNDLEIEGVAFSLKPLPRGLIKIKRLSGFKNNEICMIGDQIVTDIFSGNIYGSLTILVDPLGVKDLKITSINRVIEKMIINNYEKRGLFRKGSYYE